MFSVDEKTKEEESANLSLRAAGADDSEHHSHTSISIDRTTTAATCACVTQKRKVVDSPGYFLIEGKQVSVAMTDNETESLTITHTPRTDSKRGVIQTMRFAVEGTGTIIITSKNWSCRMVESLCTENYITVPLVMSSPDCFLPARVSNVRS